MEQVGEEGAFAYLTVIPIAEYGFNLYKQTFRDTLCVCYGWQPACLPSHCACGYVFSISHAPSCSRVAVLSIRHNQIRDLTAEPLVKVYPSVAVALVLQTLTGKRFALRTANIQDDARLDIKAQDFCDCSKRSAFFDIKVFNSHAPSNCKTTMAACYRRHKLEKQRMHQWRIRDVEHGPFTPFIQYHLQENTRD